MKRERYNKPEIRSEAIEIGAYGNYAGPVAQLQPMLGLCCSGGGENG